MLPAPALPRTGPAMSGITGKDEVWLPPLITKELVERLVWGGEQILGRFF